MQIDLGVTCDSIEELLREKYNLSEPIRLSGMDFDELSDMCVFSFETEEEDSKRIGRKWDDMAFAEGLIEEAI